MTNIITANVLALLLLFAVLCLAADFAVKNIKYIASVLKIRLFAFGILLGLITTLPEFFVGINAIVEGASALAVGNLLGGIIVLFCLILGISLILSKEIKTDGHFFVLIPASLVIFSPIILGLDGNFGFFDGMVMICLYLCFIFYLCRFEKNFGLSRPKRKSISRALVFSLAGIVVVLLSSHWIVKIVLELLNYVNADKLVVGVLVLALGTNLPEITFAFTSWRKKTAELSLSHLMSSALTHIFALGILSVIKPIVFDVGAPYFVMGLFLALTLAAFLLFYRSDKKMDRKEGLALLAIYFVFLAVNFWLMDFGSLVVLD